MNSWLPGVVIQSPEYSRQPLDIAPNTSIMYLDVLNDLYFLTILAGLSVVMVGQVFFFPGCRAVFRGVASIGGEG